jgi:hypothetical protein
MDGEQELGHLPFSTEAISPIFQTQPYEGDSKGDMDSSIQQEHQEEEYDSIVEEGEESSTQVEATSDQKLISERPQAEGE